MTARTKRARPIPIARRHLPAFYAQVATGGSRVTRLEEIILEYFADFLDEHLSDPPSATERAETVAQLEACLDRLQGEP